MGGFIPSYIPHKPGIRRANKPQACHIFQPPREKYLITHFLRPAGLSDWLPAIKGKQEEEKFT